jgi:hypothetical protein
MIKSEKIDTCVLFFNNPTIIFLKKKLFFKDFLYFCGVNLQNRFNYERFNGNNDRCFLCNW